MSYNSMKLMEFTFDFVLCFIILFISPFFVNLSDLSRIIDSIDWSFSTIVISAAIGIIVLRSFVRVFFLLKRRRLKKI
ncbi:hypothetical protein Xekj_00579 [Xenorhabdus sp. KJ12.1]|nr:hypothetical protein Xekj_00579 [Xenorhabdus sp. KJ12.1]